LPWRLAVTDEELQHLRQLRRITQERRRELEKQAAAYGRQVPTHITLDLKSADEELARIDAKMRISSISPAVQEATGPEAGIDVLRVEVRHLKDMFGTAMRTMTSDLLDMRDESREWRERQEQKHDDGAAFYRIALAILAAGLFLAFVLIAAIIGGRFL
jgi:hypothetical protein